MVWDRTNRPVWLRYAVGVLAAVIAAAIRLQFLGILELRVTFLTFFAAVAVAALYGGFGAGLVATVLSALLAKYFWMEPIGQLAITDLADLLSMLVFLASGALISYLTEATYRAQARAHKAEEQSKLSAEREKAAVDLQQTESKYRELVQNANTAIIRWKRDGAIAFFNEYAQKFFGYSEEDVLGKSINILVPEQESTGGDLTELLQDIPNHPERYANITNENILRDGSRVWMAWTNRPIFDRDGRLLEILAVGIDITERKKVEEELKVNQSRLDLALRSAHMGVWHLDIVANRRFFDDQVCHLLGIDPSKFTGAAEEFYKTVHPDDRDMIEAALARTIERDLPYETEYRAVWPDGSVHYVGVRGKMVRDDNGRPVRINGIIWDITERRRAEEEIYRQREWLRVTLTSIGDAVIATDVEGRITFINPIAAALTGWELDDAVGRPVQSVFQIINEQTRQGAENIVENVLREGHIVSLANHTVLVSRDGRGIPIEDSAAPIRDDTGNISGAVLVFHDVTERRRAQEILRESEVRLRLAVESAEMGTWDFDPITGVLNWSDRCKAVFGLSVDDNVDYQVFLQRLHPDDRQRTHEIVRSAFDPTGEGRFEAEFRSVWPDGTERWLIAAGKAFFEDIIGERRAVRFIGTVIDVTQRNQAEHKIRTQNAIMETINLIFHNALTCETEEQLGIACLRAAEDLTQSKSGFIYEIGSDDLLHSIAISNPGWEQCSMNDTIGNRRPQIDLRIHGLHGRVLLDGKSLLTNDPKSHPDSTGMPSGHPPLTAFLGVPLIHDGKTLGIVGLANREGGYAREHLIAVEAIAPAIVEALMRKRAEATLSQSQSRFRLLSETSSRLLASENPQAIVETLCRQVMQHLDCHAFFNFLIDEITGKLHLNACAAIPEEQARDSEWLDYGMAVCGCAVRDAKLIVVEDILNTPDIPTDMVKSFGIQAYACHPLEVQGKIIGTLSFGTKTRPRFSAEDLALIKTVADQVATAMEKLRLIDELRNSRDELELRVRERTAALNSYMAKLEQSNRALQDFASIAAHDMKEPLRKVISFGNMLGHKFGDSLGQSGNEYLNRMLRSTERMQSLLTSLFEYSKVTMNPEPFQEIDLNDIIQEVLSDLEVRIVKSGGEVDVGDLPVISADPTQMLQLFQNLIGNALKFHKPGEKPMVRIRFVSDPGSVCQIIVEDNGIGFEERYLDRIFAPFQRLHGRSSQYEGTGMGLAICKKIVERHGGSITASSTPGTGTCFIVRLPLRQSM
jgi:PAS domain S-box-containing protein